MKIDIEFCIKWHYDPEFERVSNIIKKNIHGAEIISNNKPPRSGAFEVTINGRLVFSKLNEGRFPNEHEIKNWLIAWYIKTYNY